MSSGPLNLPDYRKAKRRTHVLGALACLYNEVSSRLAIEPDVENTGVDSEELETFLVQLLGDHLLGELGTARPPKQLEERYCHFDIRLRNCLQGNIHSLQRFEGVLMGSGY